MRRRGVWVLGVVVGLLAPGPAGRAGAEPDRRVFSRVVHRSAAPREVSVYAELSPGMRDALRVPLWSGLRLRVLPQDHRDVESGVFAYSVQLLSADDGEPLRPVSQPAHGIGADVIAAFHFRNRDNSGPNAPGPLNVNAPGAFRTLRYTGVGLEMRVLDFEIVHARAGEVPGFSSLRILVTARESDAVSEE